jgi:hypothetical protein
MNERTKTPERNDCSFAAMKARFCYKYDEVSEM